MHFELVAALVFFVLLLVVGADAPPLGFRLAEETLLAGPTHCMQIPGWPFLIFFLCFFENPERLTIVLHLRQAAASSVSKLVVVASLFSAWVCMRMAMGMGMEMPMIEREREREGSR